MSFGSENWVCHYSEHATFVMYDAACTYILIGSLSLSISYLLHCNCYLNYLFLLTDKSVGNLSFVCDKVDSIGLCNYQQSSRSSAG